MRRYFLLPLILLAGAGVFFAVQYFSASAAPAYVKLNRGIYNWDAAGEKKKWAQRIEEIGEGEAYAEFVSVYDDSPQLSHSAMHLMADLIYERLGLEGITACDSAFGFACYHQYFKRAIDEHGIAAVRKAADLCTAKYKKENGLNGCLHGVGHGLMETFGYKKLPQALAGCADLDDIPDAKTTCWNGVFMEYLLPVYFTTGGVELYAMPLDPAAPYAPCEQAAAAGAKRSCYMALPAWWSRASRIQLPHIAQWCMIAPAPQRRMCVIGLSYEIMQDRAFDINAAKNICSTLGKAEAWCLEGIELYLPMLPTQPAS